MDLWFLVQMYPCEKKIEHFKYWKSPYSYHIVTILAKISSQPSTPSGLLFWVDLSYKAYIYYGPLAF